MAVTTSLVVQFGSESDAENFFLSAEIDSRSDGFNNGVTTFLPGDSPYYLVYKSAELSLTTVTTSGTIASAGTTSIPITEFKTFAGSKTQSLSKPPNGSVSVNVLASVGAPGTPTVSGTSLSFNEAATAVVKVSYTTTPSVFQLINVPTSLGGESSFPVVIYIVGSSS